MLTDAQCKNAKCPPDRNRLRIADSGGMYLEVSPSGKKNWFLKYRRPDGKEARMALGGYPDVGLPAARKARDAAKLQREQGTDPIHARKVEKLKALIPADDTFKAIGLEWFAKESPHWSDTHRVREQRNLEKDLFPWIGNRRADDIEALELLATVRRVEARGALDMAHRVLGTARQVLSYAVATGRARANVAREIGIALKPHRGKHFGAITDPVQFGALLRAIDGYMGGPIVKGALQLGALLFQRPTELRLAMWNEFDLDGALWTVPAERMKRTKDGKEHGAPHLVPLPRQAVELLRDLKPLASSNGMVFPGERHGRPISDNTLRAALQTMGYGGDVQTVHGFRASARTMLAEKLDVDPLLIEAQLAHEVKDANGRSYNRTSYLQQRRDMMQQWADYLDKLRAGAEVIQLPIRVA